MHKQNASPDMRILDCTLRDGGYYNNWDFPPKLVSRYLRAICLSGVRFVEIGFRSLESEKYSGAYAYSPDDFLKELDVPREIALAVMINAKEYLDDIGRGALEKVFREASLSPVSFVRVAASLESMSSCRFIFETLKKLGYQTSLNLMQASSLREADLRKACQTVESWGAVDLLYLADSTGSLDPDRTRELIGCARSAAALPVGIHAHDNRGLALQNSLAALEAGASWVDSTILGMGRGAGNVCTEILLLELKNRGLETLSPEALFPLVVDDFEPLKQKYGWGSNLLYHLSGMYGIHPTYVQEMLKSHKNETDKILTGLDFLKSSGAPSYTSESLFQAVNSFGSAREGTWRPQGWAKGKDLLILGSGPSLAQYKEEVLRFIRRNKPVVVSLNINPFVPEEFVTAYAVCHRSRLLMDADKYHLLKKPLIMPLQIIPDSVRSRLDGIQVLDYEVNAQESRFEVGERSCTVPSLLVAAYTLAIAAAAGAQRVLLCGFDGYGPSDPRQKEMDRILELYRALPAAPPVVSITPTSYLVRQSSVHSPEFWNDKDNKGGKRS